MSETEREVLSEARVVCIYKMPTGAEYDVMIESKRALDEKVARKREEIAKKHNTPSGPPRWNGESDYDWVRKYIKALGDLEAYHAMGLYEIHKAAGLYEPEIWCEPEPPESDYRAVEDVEIRGDYGPLIALLERGEAGWYAQLEAAELIRRYELITTRKHGGQRRTPAQKYERTPLPAMERRFFAFRKLIWQH
jgi:hypothetical protein